MLRSEDSAMRTQAEDALHNSEERIRLILDSATEAICGCDSEGTCLFSNPSAARILGYDDPSELIGKNMHALEHHTRKDGTPYPIEECPIYIGFQKGESVHRDDEVYWRRDGTSFPVEYWSHPVVREGRTLAAVITFIDITERKQAEAALRKSERELRTTIETIPAFVVSALPDGSVDFLSQSLLDYTGLSREQWLGWGWKDIAHPEDADRAVNTWRAALAGGEPLEVEVRYRRADGKYRWYLGRQVPLRDDKGNIVKWYGTLHDIEDRKQAEAALQKSEERWRSVYENSAIGVALTDLNGRFLAVNRAYEKILGYTEEEVCKLTFLEITEEHYRNANRELVSELLEGKRQQFQIEKQYLRKDGTLRWVSNNVSLVPGTESTPRFIMALSEDITQRKQAEAALRESEEKNRILLQINNAIITNLTQQALLHSISEALRPVFPFDRCAITLYQPERDSFRFLAVEGELHSDYFQTGLEFSREETCGSWVFEHLRPLVRRDLEKEREYANERRLVAEGIRSMCVVPLALQGECVGLLSLVSQQKNRYSDEDAVFLQEVANQVALAVQNMQSYQEIDSLKARLEKENVYLQEELRAEHNFEEIVGNSPALLKALHAVDQVAPTDSTVLIYGETGTGKELVARAIHSRSARNGRALVNVNCSAISAGLVESELFGHMKGAFTGALERRIGRFELAHGGTIFLDEIGELPPETQVKLLRVLQEHEFEPVGSSRSLRADVRVIAATNRNLHEAVQGGRFRSDLFYRLNVFPIELPPLRERRPDIPQLVAFCISRFCKRLGKKIDGVSRESMENLVNYHWPGNIRELQNVIERAVVLSAEPTLRLDRDLMPVAASTKGVETPKTDDPERRQVDLKSPKLLLSLDEVDRNHILAALQHTGGVVDGPKGAARILNLHPNTLRHRMDKLGIRGSRHRPS
ncbi:MAG: PAS domain S-box protein [Candidatus Sulfotelmatobacter sp.]|jgi:formate hydrogenlyase transcriptional activator